MTVYVLIHPTRETGKVFRHRRDASAEVRRLAALDWTIGGRIKSLWRIVRRALR